MAVLTEVLVYRWRRSAVVHVLAGDGPGTIIVPFSRVKSASNIELARRACRLSGGTQLQQQVTRERVRTKWFTLPDVSPGTVPGEQLQPTERMSTNE